jgi:hypothetical protein
MSEADAQPGLPKFRWYHRLVMLTTILAALLGLGWWIYENSGEQHVVTLDCGAGRRIVITASSSWECARPVHYRVVVDGKTVVPTHFIDCCDGNAEPLEILKFRLVQAEEGNLVGVIEESVSGEIRLVILHDFDKGESWPGLPCVQSKLQDYFGRLQRENPGLKRPSEFSR